MARCDGGPLDGELVPIERDQWGQLPQTYVEVPLLVLDEQTETVDWSPVTYCRAPLGSRAPRPGEPWAYFYYPPFANGTTATI